jgi:hypothetical protein
LKENEGMFTAESTVMPAAKCTSETYLMRYSAFALCQELLYMLFILNGVIEKVADIACTMYQ